MAAMMPDGLDAETRRVREEVTGRLERAGITTTPDDAPDALVRLLEAVESFERTVELRGGDLMVDQPVRTDRPVKPDDASFVMPRRERGEAIDAFIVRLADARRRAARSPAGPTSQNRPDDWDI
jgi:hypothetical protein